MANGDNPIDDSSAGTVIYPNPDSQTYPWENQGGGQTYQAPSTDNNVWQGPWGNPEHPFTFQEADIVPDGSKSSPADQISNELYKSPSILINQIGDWFGDYSVTPQNPETPAFTRPNTDTENVAAIKARQMREDFKNKLAQNNRIVLGLSAIQRQYGIAKIDKTEPPLQILQLQSAPSVDITLENFLQLVKKVEDANPSWTNENTNDALRALAGYDTTLFQKMFATPHAMKIVPRGQLTAQDIRTLKFMLSHGGNDYPGDPEVGTIKVGKDNVAIGHVLCGITGSLHRNYNVDISPGTLTDKSPFFQTLDNLYASTLAGDLGQSATEVYFGNRQKYIGNASEASDAELIGDLDGMYMGQLIVNGDGIIAERNNMLASGWKKGDKLSILLGAYYRTFAGQRYIYANGTINDAYLQGQIYKFSVDYTYYLREHKFRLTTILLVPILLDDTSANSKEAFSQYKLWLKNKLDARIH